MNRKILVVEDEPMVRALLVTALTHVGHETFSAANAADAVRSFRDHDPDALVVDIELGEGPTGIDLITGLLPEHPHLGVVFLTRVPDARFIGAVPPPARRTIAWLRKQDLADPSALVEAVDAVLRGDAGPELRNDLAADRPLAALSRAQVELLRMIAEGLTNDEIARRRGTTVRAVEHLIRRTFAAVGLESEEHNPRVSAVRLIAAEAALPR